MTLVGVPHSCSQLGCQANAARVYGNPELPGSNRALRPNLSAGQNLLTALGRGERLSIHALTLGGRNPLQTRPFCVVASGLPLSRPYFSRVLLSSA